MKFLIFDLNNLVRRAQHGKGIQGATGDDLAGIVRHTSLDTLRYLYDWFGGGHLVICTDRGSWRYDVYPEYKAHREYDENDETIKAVIVDLTEYLKNRTNATVLHVPKTEADDCIARWVRLHRDQPYENVIISGDGDFRQLVTDNTEVYSPNNHYLYTTTGVFEQVTRQLAVDDLSAIRHGREWKVVVDKQGDPLQFDPEYDLFLKCIRGDSSDHIRSAYPKVRETKLKAAYADRGGLLWNNLINSTWGEDGQNSVRTQYEFNRSLIDFARIPQPVLDQIDTAIGNELTKSRRTMIPIHFGKYCQQHRLGRLLDQTNSFTRMFATCYPLELADEVSSSSAIRGERTGSGRGGSAVDSACA